MIVNNKTIIITDPYHIVQKYEDKIPTFENWPGLDGVTVKTPFINYTESQFEAYKRFDNARNVALEKYKGKLDDWIRCGYGSDMSVLGFKNYICGSTLYGNLQYATYNTVTNEPIGKFCVDSGQVAVFVLDEVLKYNPLYSFDMKNTNSVAIIKNFSGKVDFKIKNYENGLKSLNVIGIGTINFLADHGDTQSI